MHKHGGKAEPTVSRCGSWRADRFDPKEFWAVTAHDKLTRSMLFR
jgi:hypothetical protein